MVCNTVSILNADGSTNGKKRNVPNNESIDGAIRRKAMEEREWALTDDAEYAAVVRYEDLDLTELDRLADQAAMRSVSVGEG